MKRFKDKNHLKWHFTEQIFVHCPNCNEKAIITNKQDRDVKLFCSSCHLLKTNNRKQYTISLNRRCPNCEKLNYIYKTNLLQKEKKYTITCSCNYTEQFEPKYREDTISGIAKDGTDYYFNTKLWLSKPFKNELFWAFNYEHLAYLKEYIDAKLRERNNRTHMTLVEVLPQFIKSAKNRIDLLKTIAVLEKK